MPITIITGDITKQHVDAIVNAANRSLLGGGGVDGAIHRAAGPELLMECRTLGGCETGDAKATKGYKLPAKYVIHTVGPVWHGGTNGERELLASCYRRSMERAAELGVKSIAFPLISAGVYGYPKREALRVAMETIADAPASEDMDVRIVIFDQSIAGEVRRDHAEVKNYIAAELAADERPAPRERRSLREKLRMAYENRHGSLEEAKRSDDDRAGSSLSASECIDVCAAEERPDIDEAETAGYESGFALSQGAPAGNAAPAAKPCDAAGRPHAPAGGKRRETSRPAGKSDFSDLRSNIDAMLDESFSEMLLRKIDERGMTDAQCYKKANIDRKLFSKIRSDRLYRPSKATALAFAIALELDLDETKALLMKAGYALSHASKFDIIVEYFIKHGNYDILEINEALFAFDQQLLGA